MLGRKRFVRSFPVQKKSLSFLYFRFARLDGIIINFNFMSEKNNQIIIYSTEDGGMKLEVKLENETVWLSQKQMAELFNCSTDNISLHLRNVYNEAELSENQTTEDSSVVQKEGHKIVERLVKLYNLDAIISVGYRINSLRGTQFRIWATRKLREYIVKGFVLDDERLSDGRVSKSYFQELEERIRKIRTSEANFYQKVRDIFATSVDYNPRVDFAKKFFAMVQNKFHFAITGLTAPEIVNSRINSNKPNMGLTNWIILSFLTRKKYWTRLVQYPMTIWKKKSVLNWLNIIKRG